MPDVRFICSVCGANISAKDAQTHECQEEKLSTADRGPDIIGEIGAYRAWQVGGDPKAGEVRLHSVTHGSHYWPSGDWTHAVCLSCEEVPNEHHTCGLYAAKDRVHLLTMHYGTYSDLDNPIVIGEVLLAGKIVVGTQGYRAEKARIKSIFVPFEFWKWAKPIEATYRGVEVSLDNWLKEVK